MLRPLLALCAIASARGFASVPAEVPAEQSKLCIKLIEAAAVDSPSDDNTGVDMHELLKGAQVLREVGCPVADNETLRMSFAEAESLTDSDNMLGYAEVDAFLADGSPAKQEEVRKCLQDRLEKNGCDYADLNARGQRATRQASGRFDPASMYFRVYAGTRGPFISNEMPYRFVAMRAVLDSFEFIQCSKSNGFWWEQTEESKTKWTRFTSNSDARWCYVSRAIGWREYMYCDSSKVQTTTFDGGHPDLDGKVYGRYPKEDMPLSKFAIIPLDKLIAKIKPDQYYAATVRTADEEDISSGNREIHYDGALAYLPFTHPQVLGKVEAMGLAKDAYVLSNSLAAQAKPNFQYARRE